MIFEWFLQAQSWSNNWTKQVLEIVVGLHNIVKHVPGFLCWSSQWKRASFFIKSRYLFIKKRGWFREISRLTSGANPGGAWLGVCTEIIGQLAQFVYASGPSKCSLSLNVNPSVLPWIAEDFSPAHGETQQPCGTVWGRLLGWRALEVLLSHADVL